MREAYRSNCSNLSFIFIKYFLSISIEVVQLIKATTFVSFFFCYFQANVQTKNRISENINDLANVSSFCRLTLNFCENISTIQKEVRKKAALSVFTFHLLAVIRFPFLLITLNVHTHTHTRAYAFCFCFQFGRHGLSIFLI